MPDQPWTTEAVDSSGVTHDHVEGHGWYANLDPTVEDLTADLHDGDILLDYSGGTGILVERLRRRIGDRRVGTLIADPSPTFLRVALEQFGGDPLVGLRLLDGSLDDALGPDLAGRGVDAVVSTNAIHLYPDFDAVAAAWARALRPGGRVYLSSGNVMDPGGRRDWLLDQTVEAIDDRAQNLVRSDRTYERYEPLLRDRELLERHAAIRRQAFPAPRPLGDYVAGLTVAGLEREAHARGHDRRVRARVVRLPVGLPRHRAGVDPRGARPRPPAADAPGDGGAVRPAADKFAAGWTYITAEKPA